MCLHRRFKTIIVNFLLSLFSTNKNTIGAIKMLPNKQLTTVENNIASNICLSRNVWSTRDLKDHDVSCAAATLRQVIKSNVDDTLRDKRISLAILFSILHLQ